MRKVLPRIAIVAALEREVRPLVRGWKSRMIEHDGRRYRLFENGEAALLWGGIGAEAARRATEAVIREVNPFRVVSVGYAGALHASLRVGDVVMPSTVVNTADGSRIDLASGDGVLVSSATVAGKEQKIHFAKAYGALAVDMEAAAVARGAQARGVEFGVIKVISDASDFNILPLDGFITGDGNFQSIRFARHVALRPRLWGTAIALARNSFAASTALCVALGVALADYMDREGGVRESLPAEFSASDSAGELDAANFELANADAVNREEFAGAHTVNGVVPHTKATRKP